MPNDVHNRALTDAEIEARSLSRWDNEGGANSSQANVRRKKSKPAPDAKERIADAGYKED